MAPAREALGAAVPALAAAGCETPELDAELLIADAVGVERHVLIGQPELEIPPAAARVIGERVRRRVAREPVAYILGRRGFHRIELAVDPRVLIPRPETELLVDLALELREGARVHEVGTGSGAVALAALKDRPDLQLSASDASPGAVEVARANAERLGIGMEIQVADGLPDGRYDTVLANLPYVSEEEWGGLQPEIVKYEPRDALVAGPTGLEAIEALVAQAPAGTPVALEHAPHQAEAVRALLRGAETRRDLAGRDRVTLGVVP